MFFGGKTIGFLNVLCPVPVQFFSKRGKIYESTDDRTEKVGDFSFCPKLNIVFQLQGGFHCSGNEIKQWLHLGVSLFIFFLPLK